MATQEQVREVLQRLQLQGQRIAALEREREVMIEETRAQTAEIERSALIQTLVTMRQERGGAMLKNGKGKGKPNSAEKVSSQSVLLEDRHTVKVTAPESGAAVTW